MIWTAFILGMAGSLHCVGMCGPIALALPGDRRQSLKFISGRLIYQTGRIITYISLGLLAGIFGKGISLLGVQYLQQITSIGLGCLLIIMALIPATQHRIFIPSLQILIAKVKMSLASLLKKRHYPSLFAIGLLNGLLPCGLVYSALLGALSASSPEMAMNFMLFFGLGTFPLMLATSLLGHIITPSLRSKYTWALTVCMVFLGIFLIGRGIFTSDLSILSGSATLDTIKACFQ